MEDLSGGHALVLTADLDANMLRAESPPILRRLLDAAIEAAQAARQIPLHLPEPPRGRVVVVGAGKASAAMAQAFEMAWPGALSGLVVTRYGHRVPCERIEIVEAAHPQPDLVGESVSRRMLGWVSGLTADDLVVGLWSGGGSALLPLALPGITLAEKQLLTRQLLKCGASITEINCVRRHLSLIKGGRLALACAPARVVNLLISDVPGDTPADIASGPMVGDVTTCVDARAVLKRYQLNVPDSIWQALERDAAETPFPDDPRLQAVESRIIATPQMALEAAAETARQAGWSAHVLSDAIEGEARDVAKVLAAIALQIKRRQQPFPRPCILLSSGETTVTVRGNGRGGRNVEFLLALALALRGEEGIYALAADTDGIDGTDETAGAWIGPHILQQAAASGWDVLSTLDNNNAHALFAALGNDIVTGRTHTNVNDFRAILIQ